jgi:hypothetical protein
MTRGLDPLAARAADWKSPPFWLPARRGGRAQDAIDLEAPRQLE